MSKLGQEAECERLRLDDWRDKYRWPDPVDGWSGALAGYPMDHKIRHPGPRLVAKHATETHATETPDWLATETLKGKGGRPKSDDALSSTERSRISRARKKGEG